MGGRPPLLQAAQITKMLNHYDERKLTVAEICKIYGISRPSFYNYLKKRKKEMKAIMAE
jgi:AcrR family transcriptional regulator